jgi:hypothetical protein
VVNVRRPGEITATVSDRAVTVAELERWVQFGARWRAVEISEQRAVIDLCQCTGELVERRVSHDRPTIDWIRAHLPPADD